MIPRLKPYLGKEELLAALAPGPQAVTRFEEAFAGTFETGNALAFSYGRSGLWAFFKAMGIENAEVIMPAYTCVVVAHATLLSGNIPRFVDINLHDYNMDLDQVESAINDRTRVVIATHLFGYPLDIECLAQIVADAEARYGHKIWVVQDCAHSFGARWRGKLVCSTDDIALFGLNISKTIHSIFGGMVSTNDPDLCRSLRAYRDQHFAKPTWLKNMRRLLYLLAIYPAFNPPMYGLVNWLEEDTPLLNRLTRAYHLDEKVHFPPDYRDQMTAVEAAVGLVQLTRYNDVVVRRRAHAQYYQEQLPDIPGWDMPPLVEGATYSHYVIRVPDRRQVLQALRARGVQLGELIQYSVPHMPAYESYSQGKDFPNSLVSSRHTVNLPIHPKLQEAQREQIVRSLVDFGTRKWT